MDNLAKNFIKSASMLWRRCFIYLKHELRPSLSCVFKQELKASFNFLTTLNNISVLDERLRQGVSPERSAETERNLLACVNYGEAQTLFFNISGAEFFHVYVCVSLARVSELLKRIWNKGLLFVENFSRRIMGNQPKLQDGVEILKLETKASAPAGNRVRVEHSRTCTGHG